VATRARRPFGQPPPGIDERIAAAGQMPQPYMMPGVPTQAPGIGAAQQQHAAGLAAALQAAQAAPGGAPPQVGMGPQGPMPANLGTLGDMARLQQQNQIRAAAAPGQGWDMARAVGLGGAFGGLGGPVGAGVGAGAAGLMELLRQRRAKQPLKQATGGLVKAEPQRMAMGGAAKVRKDFPHTPPLPKKNSHGNPLTAKGMGKANRGGSFKGSL